MGTWTEARDKIRRDLWREETGDGVGIPDAALDEAIHQACVDLEGERRWCYLEMVQQTTNPVTVNRLSMPILSRGINWLAAINGTERRYLTIAPLDRVIDMAALNNTRLWPDFYAISGTEIYLDCTMDGGTLEASHTFVTPDTVAEALERGDDNVTLLLQYQMICARASSIVALTYLKDEAEASRQDTAFKSMLDKLEMRDDAMRDSMTKPEIEPDVGVAPYNWQ